MGPFTLCRANAPTGHAVANELHRHGRSSNSANARLQSRVRLLQLFEQLCQRFGILADLRERAINEIWETGRFGRLNMVAGPNNSHASSLSWQPYHTCELDSVA